MNDEPGASTWRNPLAVENAGAERISRALTLGADLRRKVAAGCALGTFVLESPVPATLGAMALAGFDFVVIDMEHSTDRFLAARSADRRGPGSRPRRHWSVPGARTSG